jgi:Cu+-exporting ATPase
MGHPGVLACSVNLLVEKAEASFDGSVTTAEELAKVVSDVGYDASVLSVVRGNAEAAKRDDVAVSLIVTGLTGPGSLSEVEACLRALPFVLSAEGDSAESEVVVHFDSTKPHSGVRQLVKAIATLGQAGSSPLKAKLKTTTGQSSADDIVESSQRKVRMYQMKLGICLLFSVPAFFLAMIAPLIRSMANVLMLPVIGQLTWHGLLLWILVTPVQFGIGATFYRSAWAGLKHGSANMALLVALGTSAAYVYSLIDVVILMAKAAPLNPHAGHGMADDMTMDMGSASHFFETSSTLITFVLLGRLLEVIAKGRTSQALTHLMSMEPSEATLVELEGDASDGVIKSEELVPIELLQEGDVIKVIRGGKVPCDGEVVWGHGTVDESMITGESMPVGKVPGDRVIGATINSEGVMLVRATDIGEDSMLRKILKLMEDAQTTKAPIQAFADYVSSIFVPAVCGISLITFVGWYAAVKSGAVPHDWLGEESDLLFAFLFSIACLVIACPCALGLATPTAIMVSTGIGASLGVLIKGGQALETAHKVTAFVFDKTGTLTIGKPVVTALTVVQDDVADAKAWSEELAFLAASAELNSEHILGEAIVAFGKSGKREAQQPTVRFLFSFPPLPFAHSN